MAGLLLAVGLSSSGCLGPANRPPVAFISVSTKSAPAGETIEFDASRSEDRDGRIVSYRWEFGDKVTTQGVRADHEYPIPGRYVVTLTVRDDGDATGTDSVEIDIDAAPPPPPACTAPMPAPGVPRLVAKSDSSVSIAWVAPAPGEDCSLQAFTVYRDGAHAAALPATWLDHTSTGLLPVKTYSFQVSAANEAGESARSAPLDVTTDPLAMRGPAAELLIDCSVHTGKAWDGSTYCGVWGESFDFKIADHPVTWAIALVHASALLRSANVSYSPDAVLSVAIKESRLECPQPNFPNRDGCFQIENTTAYAELRGLWPERFTAPHSQVIEGARFETSALASVYYVLFSLGMFHLHSDDPVGFFAGHPDGRAMQKVLNGAYNRGLWWTGLANVFANCRDRDPVECFEDHKVAIDHAQAIVNYTIGLERSRPFDGTLTRADLEGYWQRVKVLYPNISAADVTRAIDIALAGAGSGPFQEVAYRFVPALIAALPPLPSHEETIAKLCDKGYLTKSPPCG
ncbi:MAG TPA: PKD domain-containing protein [Thermoplasmata archaeon]|nr:PKD domain-containing protein [Thermoplasmata archaeon]